MCHSVLIEIDILLVHVVCLRLLTIYAFNPFPDYRTPSVFTNIGMYTCPKQVATMIISAATPIYREDIYLSVTQMFNILIILLNRLKDFLTS